LKIGAKKRNSFSMNPNGKSNLSKKAIDGEVLVAAAATFLTQCPLTACVDACLALFGTVLNKDTVEAALTAEGVDFAVICKPSVSGGGGGGGSGDDGFLKFKASVLLLLTSLAIGHFFF
jgi:hypothetical protein